MALSKSTRDHSKIRQWAEARNAEPAEVSSTAHPGKTGILRLEFPKTKQAKDDNLEQISWDEFFEKFDASGLEFIYQEKTASGERSNFNKLIYPENKKSSLDEDENSDDEEDLDEENDEAMEEDDDEDESIDEEDDEEEIDESEEETGKEKKSTKKDSKEPSSTKASPHKSSKRTPVKKAGRSGKVKQSRS